MKIILPRISPNNLNWICELIDIKLDWFKKINLFIKLLFI